MLLLKTSAKVDAPGCVNTTSQLMLMWYTTAEINFTKPGASTFANVFTCYVQSIFRAISFFNGGKPKPKTASVFTALE